MRATIEATKPNTRHRRAEYVETLLETSSRPRTDLHQTYTTHSPRPTGDRRPTINKRNCKENNVPRRDEKCDEKNVFGRRISAQSCAEVLPRRIQSDRIIANSARCVCLSIASSSASSVDTSQWPLSNSLPHSVPLLRCAIPFASFCCCYFKTLLSPTSSIASLFFLAHYLSSHLFWRKPLRQK